MEWIFTPKTRARNYPFLITGGLRGSRSTQNSNTVGSYQLSLFPKLNFLAFYVLLTKCSALLIPITSSKSNKNCSSLITNPKNFHISAEIGSTQLCPNPVDWQEPFTSLFPYRFFPNNVVVMDLVRNEDGTSANDSLRESVPPLPCRFRIGGPDTGVKPGHALLLSLQQRQRPLSFMQRCSKVLEVSERKQGLNIIHN